MPSAPGSWRIALPDGIACDGLSQIRNSVSPYGYRLHDSLPAITALLRDFVEQLPGCNGPDVQSASMLHGRHYLLLRRNLPGRADAGSHASVTTCDSVVTCGLGLPHQQSHRRHHGSPNRNHAKPMNGRH